jgi:hypothetical protein
MFVALFTLYPSWNALLSASHNTDLTAKTHFCSHRGQESGVSKNKELGRLFFAEIQTSRLIAGTSTQQAFNVTIRFADMVFVP